MLTFNFNPFPILETDRLLLRPLELKDARTLHELRNIDIVMQYIMRPRSKTVQESEAYIQRSMDMVAANEAITWAIGLKDNPDHLIGTMGYYRTQFENFRSEMGYLLHPVYWRKGLMSEAIQVTLDFGFNPLGFHSVEACIDPNNIASREVLKKNGFVKEAYFKENYYYEGQFYDTEVYSILRSASS